MNDTVNEHVYTVNKRVSIIEATGINSKELHSEIMNLTLPRHRRKYNIDHTRLPSIRYRSWSRFLAVSLQITGVINPTVGCHYFLPGPQLPTQPIWWLLPILLLGEQRHNGCEQFAQDCYPTVSRLRFEPRPYCAWVQHVNHSATEPLFF